MSALRRILSTVLALVFAVGITAGPLAGGAAAAGAIPPAPVPEPAICVDLPGVLGAETCRTVTAKLEADEKATGDELAVLVVRTTGDESIEEYALRAFNTWGVGQAGEDNGVLLVVALDDRTVRIQVGSGLEKTVTDGRAREIIGAELVPMFRAGSYRQGILNGLDALRVRLGHEVTASNSLASIPQDPGYRPPAPAAAPRTSVAFEYAYDRDEDEAQDSGADTKLILWVVLLVVIMLISWGISAARGGGGGDGDDSGSGYRRRSSWGSTTRGFSSRSSSSRSGSRSGSGRSSFGGGRSRGAGGSGKW